MLVIPINIWLNYKIIMKGDVFMTAKKTFSTEEATSIGEKLGPVSYTHLTLPTNREV